MQHFSCRTASALIDIYVLLFIPFEGSVGQDQLAAQLISAQETENRRRTAIPHQRAGHRSLPSGRMRLASSQNQWRRSSFVEIVAFFEQIMTEEDGTVLISLMEFLFQRMRSVICICRGVGVLESESTYFNIYENL